MFIINNPSGLLKSFSTDFISSNCSVNPHKQNKSRERETGWGPCWWAWEKSRCWLTFLIVPHRREGEQREQREPCERWGRFGTRRALAGSSVCHRTARLQGGGIYGRADGRGRVWREITLGWGGISEKTRLRSVWGINGKNRVAERRINLAH